MKNAIRSVSTAICLFTLTVGAVSRLHAEGTAPSVPWPHETSDLKPNPNIIFGRLDNGFRYMILPNKEPKDRISLRLCIDAGSMMETESERGIAHFLEHMAFNGSEHFPTGQVFEFFARLKMGFVADTNAVTKWDSTMYMLELPDGAERTLNDSLNFMRDVAGGMLFPKEEIEKERGVIFSEMRESKNATRRRLDDELNFILPDTLLGKRDPLGLEIVVKTAPREKFVQFYQKWYTPDRIVLIAVGDLKPADMGKRVQEKFGTLKAAAQRQPSPNLGKIEAGRGLEAKFHTDKDMGEMLIRFIAVRPGSRQADTLASHRLDLVKNMVVGLLNRRLEKLARKENASIAHGGARREKLCQFADIDNLTLTCRPDQWEQALAVGEQEIRRAIQHGFTNEELAELITNFNAIADSVAAQSVTARSAQLASMLVGAVESHAVPISLADVAEFMRSEAPKVTLDQLHQAVRGTWDTKDIKVFLAGNLELKDAPEKIKAVYLKSQQVPVQPYEAKKLEAFAYTNFGAPGKVIKREELKDLGVTQVVFENNVRLNIKPTDFTKDSILLEASFGGGRLSLPKDNPALAPAAASFIGGGLEKHSNDDLMSVLAGRMVGWSFDVEDDVFSFSGATNRKDLLLQCQLLGAYLAAPGFREAPLIQFQSNLDGFFTDINSSPIKLYGQEAGKLVHNGDPRFSEGNKEQLRAITMKDVRAWLAQPLDESYLEIAIVGDVDVNEAINAVAATIGALPKRAAARLPYVEERKVQLATFKEKTLTCASKDPLALAAIFWPTTDSRKGIREALEMNVLATILQDSLIAELREKLGDTYTPSASSAMSGVFDGDGVVQALLTCDPSRADDLGKIVIKIAADLAANGATEDQFNRAKLPLVKRYEDSRRNNGWWLGWAAEIQALPHTIEDRRNLFKMLDEIDLAAVNTRAKKYLGADRAFIIKVMPESKVEAVSPKKSVQQPAVGRASNNATPNLAPAGLK